MAKRVTIMIDDELDRKIRERQVRMMLERNRMYSLSEAVNDILAGGVMRFWEMLWVGGGSSWFESRRLPCCHLPFCNRISP